MAFHPYMTDTLQYWGTQLVTILFYYVELWTGKGILSLSCVSCRKDLVGPTSNFIDQRRLLLGEISIPY